MAYPAGNRREADESTPLTLSADVEPTSEGTLASRSLAYRVAALILTLLIWAVKLAVTGVLLCALYIYCLFDDDPNGPPNWVRLLRLFAVHVALLLWLWVAFVRK